MSARVLIFTCNWDGWSCVDAAANAGLGLPASVNIVKLTCLSSVSAGFVLKAFEHGVDGVMLLGCQNRQCPHGQFGGNIEKECGKAAELIKMLGVKGHRILLARLDAFDGTGFVERLNEFMHSLKGARAPAAEPGHIEAGK